MRGSTSACVARDMAPTMRAPKVWNWCAHSARMHTVGCSIEPKACLG